MWFLILFCKDLGLQKASYCEMNLQSSFQENLYWFISALESKLCSFAGQGKTARAGYIGHVTHLANQLVNLPYREIVAECKEKSEKWDEWSNHTLRDRNNAEDTLQWGCGRPQSTTVASISSSEEMDGSIKEILTFRVFPDFFTHFHTLSSLSYLSYILSFPPFLLFRLHLCIALFQPKIHARSFSIL